MHLFRCPCCGNLSLSWDPRSGHFLCRSVSCTASFPAPDPELLQYTGDIARALTLGTVAGGDVQEWLNQQGQGPGAAPTPSKVC